MRLLLFKSGCGSNTTVELHNTKKPLSVSVQPPKTGLLSCSQGTWRPEREQDHSVCPPTFHGLRTNTNYCLSRFASLVCVCRRSSSSSAVAVNALDQYSFGFVSFDKLLGEPLAYVDHPCRTVLVGFFDPVRPSVQEEKSTPFPRVHRTLFSTTTP